MPTCHSRSASRGTLEDSRQTVKLSSPTRWEPRLGDLVLPQESDDGLAIAASRRPYGPTPIVNRNVTLGPGWHRQHIGNRHASPSLWQIDTRPLSFSAPELHVYFLDLTPENCRSTRR